MLKKKLEEIREQAIKDLENHFDYVPNGGKVQVDFKGRIRMGLYEVDAILRSDEELFFAVFDNSSTRKFNDPEISTDTLVTIRDLVTADQPA